MKPAPTPLISQVITALFELQEKLGDVPITLAREEVADAPLPGICGLGVRINGANGQNHPRD
jgi:hypothetical protein